MTELIGPETRRFYCEGLRVLGASGVDFLVGGAYAMERYTGIARHTKDFDIFVRPRDRDRILEVLRGAGYQTELTFPHWLGKAFCADDFIDVIFGSGNGVAVVDDEWFTSAVDDEILELPVRLCPPEEMVWSKAFIMERERYDGADIAHVLRACAERLDWSRLLRRFENHWPVLLSHLILFGFIYPGERSRLPAWVMADLLDRARDGIGKVAGAEENGKVPTAEGGGSVPIAEDIGKVPTVEGGGRVQAAERICQGTLLSRAQYLVDIHRWGYADARLPPSGTMKPEDAAHWTAAIEE
jgi:hypothetical protein